LKIEKVNAGCGVYSGLYIITELDMTFDDIRNIIVSEDFAKYIRLLKKYKSGGYYTFNTKDVQQYINYFYFINFN
jgi:adenine-specific DNA-methyltransferase